ncbi:MAG: hypothetical protein M3036_09300, partial [Bifidobacteriales bacterium]|nr:hypothetical protein [Bifidobacteriales bacterium]
MQASSTPSSSLLTRFMAMLRVEGQNGDAALQDWIALLKPRVISLVVFTGLAGMAVAPKWPSIPVGLVISACICIGAGAA